METGRRVHLRNARQRGQLSNQLASVVDAAGRDLAQTCGTQQRHENSRSGRNQALIRADIRGRP